MFHIVFQVIIQIFLVMVQTLPESVKKEESLDGESTLPQDDALHLDDISHHSSMFDEGIKRKKKKKRDRQKEGKPTITSC